LRAGILIVVMAVVLSACASGAGAVMASAANSPVVTPLYDIQGSGKVSPMNGQAVTVRGIVTGDFQNGDADLQNQLGGFYLQEEKPDEDPATSDGVFVFDGSTPTVDVNVGDRVTVGGTVNEYFGETQISATRVDVSGPAAGVIAETNVNLPATGTVTNSDGELIADLERFEGMLVRFPQVLTVGDMSDLERYGEIQLTQGGRLHVFTNDNAPDVAGYAAYGKEIAGRSVLLDDGLSIRNADSVRYVGPPTIRIGDTVANLTGNVRFASGSGPDGLESYRLMPTREPSFISVNPRPAASPDVGGTLTVAGVNMDNYFTTIDMGKSICGPSGNSRCRGADSQEEFDRQYAKIIRKLTLLDADIVGLSEIENNATESLHSLVDGLNAVMGPGTYASVDTGTIGSDVIRVGFLYKPEIVSLVGDFAILDSHIDRRFDDARNRPMLVQSFTQKSNGAIVTVAVNHLKSKSSSCASIGDPDRNDGQSECNVTRSDAAAAMADWLATDPTGVGDPDILIIGDLNANPHEDPMIRLGAAGYDNLLEILPGTYRYSYVFKGRAGAIDHALTSPSLTAQVTGVSEWHINADEAPVHDYNLEFGRDPGIFDDSTPYRAGDHDPIVVGLELTP
jgi:predicted extracellular nuclease